MVTLTPTQLSILKTDITSGPLASECVGQSVFVISGLFKAPGAGNVTIISMSRNDFLLAIAPASLVLPGLSTALQAKWDRIISMACAADPIEVGSTTIQALLVTAVSDGVLTQDQSTAISQTEGSREQVLFGLTAALTTDDYQKALES